MSNNYHKDKEIKAIQEVKEIYSTMPDYIAKYIRSIQQKTEPSTRLAYIKDIKNFMEYYCQKHKGNLRMKDITCEMLSNISGDFFDEYFDYLQNYEKNGQVYTNGRVTIKRKLSSLRNFFGYMFANDLISVNNIEKVSMPKLKDKEIIYMDEEETTDFLNSVEFGRKTGSRMEEAYHEKLKQRDYAITTLLLSTGLRVSECVGLNINDVDFKNSCVKVIRKSGKEGTVYFSDEAADILSDYMEYRKKQVPKEGHEDALFLSTRMTRMGVRAIEILVKKYAQQAVPMKNISPHKLRSTFGTALYEQTGDIYVTADALGHKNINVTQKHYANLTNSRKASVRNKVSLNRNNSVNNDNNDNN